MLGFPNSSLVAYATRGKADAFTVPADKQIYIYNARAFNNSGSSQAVGICRKANYAQMSLDRYTAVGTSYTDLPLPLSATTTIFSGTINDGFALQSARKFNVLGLHIVTGQATGVYVYEYWNGSAWTTLTTLTTITFTAASNDTDQWASFRAPVDWAKGATGLDADKYQIRIRSTTAPAGAISANSLWVGEFLEYYEGVPNNAAVQLSFPDTKPFLLNGGEGLFPYFATANAANQFGAYYSILS